MTTIRTRAAEGAGVVTGADPAANGQASGRKQRPKAEVRLYEVRGSLPPTETRNWRGNLSVMVLAPTLADALRHVLMTRPFGTEVHDIRKGERYLRAVATPNDIEVNQSPHWWTLNICREHMRPEAGSEP